MYKGKNICKTCFTKEKAYWELYAEFAGGHVAAQNYDPEEEAEAQNPIYQENPTYHSLCRICMDVTLHHNHGSYGICTGCDAKITDMAQDCLGCEVPKFVIINKGNRCADCLEQANQE